MTYREAIRALLKAGIRNRQGSRHHIFYAEGGGMVTVPDKAKEMSTQHRSLVDKLLNGNQGSRTSNRR